MASSSGSRDEQGARDAWVAGGGGITAGIQGPGMNVPSRGSMARPIVPDAATRCVRKPVTAGPTSKTLHTIWPLIPGAGPRPDLAEMLGRKDHTLHEVYALALSTKMLDGTFQRHHHHKAADMQSGGLAPMPLGFGIRLHAQKCVRSGRRREPRLVRPPRLDANPSHHTRSRLR